MPGDRDPSPAISRRSAGEDAVDRAARCCKAFRDYLDAHDLEADWEGVDARLNETLVNALAMMAPFGAAEKQALLEAPDLQTPRRDAGRAHRDVAGARAGAVGTRCNEPGHDRADSSTPRPSKPARIDPKLLEILVCPLTKTTLEYDAERQELISRAARLAYPIRDGIPIMLADEARQLDDDEASRPLAGGNPPEARRRSPSRSGFDDGNRFRVCGRVSAGREPERRGQGPRSRPGGDGAGKRDVRITRLEPVGNYAVRIVFDDGHSTGSLQLVLSAPGWVRDHRPPLAQ